MLQEIYSVERGICPIGEQWTRSVWFYIGGPLKPLYLA